jgi:hypothetical protein
MTDRFISCRSVSLLSDKLNVLLTVITVYQYSDRDHSISVQ